MRALLRLVSLRHLFRFHPLRTTLTTVGIALGVAAVVAMSLANRSITAGMREATEQVAGKAELVVSGDASGMPEEILERVKSVPGLRHAAPLIKQVAAITKIDGKDAHGMLQIYGVDALDDRTIPDASFKKEDLELEDPLLFLNTPRSLIVTRKFAEAHGLTERADKAKIHLGTSVGVLEFTVRGFLKSEGPARVFGGNFALMDVFSAQKVFGKERRFDEINVLLPEKITPEARDAFREKILAAVGPGHEVERPLNRGRQSERIIGTFQSALTLVSMVTLLVGAFLVYNSVVVSVAERRREIGILRALGARRREIAGLFAIEAAAMGAVGSTVGALAGMGIARFLVRMTSEVVTNTVEYVDVRDVRLSGAAIAFGILAGVGAAVASALFPAIEASRVPPLEATRPTSAMPVRRRRAKLAAFLGLVLLGLAGAGVLHPASRQHESLAFGTAVALLSGFILLCPLLAPILARLMAPIARLSFGVTGRLAADNLVRAPARATVTVSAILVGFALVISSTTVAKSFKVEMDRFLERTVPADLMVTATTEIFSTTTMPLVAGVRDLVAAVPGVEDVIGLRTFGVDVGGRRADLIAFDVGRWVKHAAVSWADGSGDGSTAALTRGDAVAVSENLARTFGVKRGDDLPVRTPKGVVRLRIAGVYVDYSSPFGIVLADWKLFRRHWDEGLFSMLNVFLRKGADVTTVRSAIDGAVRERFNAFVISNAGFKRRVSKMIDDTFELSRVQELIAMLVALLGLMNTLLIAVLERTREIGVLRAVGASRRQVAAIIVVESSLMALAGAILGVVLGTALSWVNIDVISIVHTGWRVPYEFDGLAVAKLFVSSLVVAALAAYLPGRRAARLTISEALEYE